MIPPFEPSGLLPAGTYSADWSEISSRFGNSGRRKWLLEGLLRVLIMLRTAGCQSVYLDGSFVTDRAEPEDFDALWETIGVRGDLLDPIILDFEDKRIKQKLKYRGELFPVHSIVEPAGIPFLEFFQKCKVTGEKKGIVKIELSALP